MTKLNNFPFFDAHMHLIPRGFPLIENQGYRPEYFEFSDYQQRMANYDLIGGALVTGSFQGKDQSYLLHCLNHSKGYFTGVTDLPDGASDADILHLNQAGVKGCRFNLKRGKATDIQKIDTLARRVHELCGWHAEFYVDTAEIEPLMPVLKKLPAFSIDHLGLSQTGLGNLMELVEAGAMVKASGFSRGDLDVSEAIRLIYQANPDCLMFGSDLPSTRAPTPYQDKDFLMVIEQLGVDAAHKVFSKNALDFYGCME